ncbi:MAG: fimbrial assembly protein, partial [Methylococcales bacterium]|nr:fimbrial assembly protein [Methylococcales bacterium]
AAKLIRKLESSSLFQDAKINGQLTKDRKTGLQRFYLTANVVKKGGE